MRKFLIAVAFFAAFALPALADELQLREDAPDKYVVIKGDTLWDISGRFLKKPWRWPEIWNLNREQIKNPHWIYPGDTIVLDRSGAQPRLRLVPGAEHGLNTTKLSPYARETPIETNAIPTIPVSIIHPFLSQPRVVAAGDMDKAPFILGTNEERIVLAKGDTAYATGGPSNVVRWNILRPGKALKDPETGDVLGYEVEYLGDARTLLPGAPQKILITSAAQEILPKDKLLPANDDVPFEYAPHAPEGRVTGRIISAYGGISDSGRYQTVVINRGSRDGVDLGQVLAIYQAGETVKLSKEERERITWMASKAGAPDTAWLTNDVRCLNKDGKVTYDQPADTRGVYRSACLANADENHIKLPDARSGLLMVYRVYDRVAYALIMQSDQAVHLLDTVRNP
ncbi:MAG TPA: LysM peptidoglycan-binding domain-containing protein [Thiobacillaceae bacterium]|nr:LysM peptidoglycan-binding domain-containing protein [Thiobacillaceae bacterium]